MGKSWDKLEAQDSESSEESGDPESQPDTEQLHAHQDWHRQWLRLAFRALQPGGLIKAFGGTRTFHRLAQAMEDVGFEVQGVEAWCYGCLSEDTEIMTSRGWRPWQEAQVGTLVMGFNPVSESLYLQPVEETFEYYYNQDAYHLVGEGTDQLVSEGHRCLVQRQGQWAFVPVQDLDPTETVPLPGTMAPQRVQVTIDKVPYTGTMWCVRVGTGAFVARRNGMAFITGNSGFPKSLNIEKAIDRHLGKSDEREVLGDNPSSRPNSKKKSGRGFDTMLGQESAGVQEITAPASELAKKWAGYGTALKPAFEPFVVGRKPYKAE